MKNKRMKIARIEFDMLQEDLANVNLHPQQAIYSMPYCIALGVQLVCAAVGRFYPLRSRAMPLPRTGFGK